jgi:hypothetical protein
MPLKESEEMNYRMRIVLLTMALIGLILSSSCASSKTPAITTNSLPEGTEDVAYSHTLEVQGGSPPYIWSVSGGTLPIGLQLNPTSGVISGTPIIATNPAFVTFMVTDNSKKIAFKQILMTVNPTTTTTSTTTNSATVSSITGLSLSLSLDGTTYQPNQEVSITVDEVNSLSGINNVPVSNNRPYSSLQAAPCDYISPYGIAVFQGNYTTSNFSTGTPLTLYDPHVARLCPTTYGITSYSFESSNDMAAVIETSNPSPTNSSQQMKYELTINGYWPDDNFSSNSQLTSFEPGVYTVVAGDEWGALVVVHFTVSQ